MARASKSDAEKRITQLKRLILKELKKRDALTVMHFKEKFPNDGTLVREAAMRLVQEQKAERLMIRGRVAVKLAADSQHLPADLDLDLDKSPLDDAPCSETAPVEQLKMDGEDSEQIESAPSKLPVNAPDKMLPNPPESDTPLPEVKKPTASLPAQDEKPQDPSLAAGSLAASEQKELGQESRLSQGGSNSICELSDVAPAPLLEQAICESMRPCQDNLQERLDNYQAQLDRAKRAVSEKIEANELAGTIYPPSPCPQSTLKRLEHDIHSGKRSAAYIVAALTLGCFLLLLMAN